MKTGRWVVLEHNTMQAWAVADEKAALDLIEEKVRPDLKDLIGKARRYETPWLGDESMLVNIENGSIIDYLATPESDTGAWYTWGEEGSEGVAGCFDTADRDVYQVSLPSTTDGGDSDPFIFKTVGLDHCTGHKASQEEWENLFNQLEDA